MEVDILQRQIFDQLAGLILGGDLLQPLVDGGNILGRNNALLAQHGDMRAAALDVLAPQAFVDADGGVDFLHDRRRAGAEAAAPQAVCGAGWRCRVAAHGGGR